MAIDFERECRYNKKKKKKHTGPVSRDQKCKRKACTWEMSPNKRPKTSNCFEREPERMRSDEKRNNNDTQLPN